MNSEIHYKITQFYYREAYLLDHRKYREWLDLLTDEIRYRMPLRATVENKEGSNIVEEMTYFEENKNTLKARVERLYENSAWVENPAPRQRHFVQNVMITEGSNSNEYNVRSYVQATKSRASDYHYEQIIGEREDVLLYADGEFKIALRTIYIDQTVLNTMNISTFL